MKKKSEIREAIDWLDWRAAGIRETAYDEELLTEMSLLRNDLLNQKRMTIFQRKKLEWLKILG